MPFRYFAEGDKSYIGERHFPGYYIKLNGDSFVCKIEFPDWAINTGCRQKVWFGRELPERVEPAVTEARPAVVGLSYPFLQVNGNSVADIFPNCFTQISLYW